MTYELSTKHRTTRMSLRLPCRRRSDRKPRPRVAAFIARSRLSAMSSTGSVGIASPAAGRPARRRTRPARGGRCTRGHRRPVPLPQVRHHARVVDGRPARCRLLGAGRGCEPGREREREPEAHGGEARSQPPPEGSSAGCRQGADGGMSHGISRGWWSGRAQS